MQLNSDLFIHVSIHSFSKYMLYAYFVPGTVKGARNIMVNEEDTTSFLVGLHFSS